MDGLNRLKGKVAIVTGAGMGLGRGYAMALAKEGASVVVNDLIPEAANKTIDDIKALGTKAVACIGGVGTKEIADKLVSTAASEFGRLDILVNNAGMTRDAMFLKMTEEQFDAVIMVHLRGSFINSQAAAKYMVDNGIKGRIINITSSAGIYGNIGQANYCSAKAGIIGLTYSNSRELARFGICVNAIAPGAKTAMTEAIPEKVRAGMYEMLGKQNTLQRMAEPEDVAPIIVFLASEESYFISGQIIGAMGSVGVM